MKSRTAAHLCVAGLLASGVGASAQATTASQNSASAAGDIKVTGCVVSESDYRKAHDEGKGGVVGTGVGAGNEFVLMDASTDTERPSASPATTGTSGTATGTAYELTGTGEGQLGRYVGHRVELTGKFKDGTGGPGVNLGGKDMKLRSFDVMSSRELPGTCPVVK